ncbi:ATP-binding protein [Arthrobacter sp. NPDC056493]|uniref:ATP-binding protein n=1 Tax=Arthrobacter sp. NPDC056493 TaxID=3345839 RepID=UPI0036711731
MDTVRMPGARALPRTRWGVRKRATATAVVVVAAGLLVGGLILLVLLQTSLVAAAEAAARGEAEEVAGQVSAHGVDEGRRFIESAAHSGQYVQILDPQGSVLASSVPAVAATSLTGLRPEAGQTLTQDVPGLPSIGDDDEFLIVALGVRDKGVLHTVAVAATIQVEADTLATVAWFALGAMPLLLVLVGAAVWTLVGRSLCQVDTIRGQVAMISARRLDGRVEVPPTADEIQALAQTMNQMLDRLEAADVEQRRFISDASHELRSPLTTLSAGLEIAAADPTGRTWEEMKPVLAGETARMRYLVEDLLTLAKTNDGALHLKMTDVDLDDVLHDEITRLRSTSRHRIEARLEPARVTGDAHRLAQVIRNVLDNADRHAESRITVQVQSSEVQATISIDNDGPPVPVLDRKRIFERFVRLDESRSRERGGTGLGLAIAAALMAAHHGSIGASVAPDGGCRFELVFRRAANAVRTPTGKDIAR